MPGCTALKARKWERRWVTWATGEEMKVLLVCVLMLLVTAMAVAFGSAAANAAAAQVFSATPEPAALLLSGSALLGLAGAVKRLTF